MFDTPVELPLENTDLVSEHHDLDVPLGLGPSTTTQRNRTCDTGRGRGARRAHRIMSETAANFLVKGPIVLLVSFRTRVRRTGHLSAKCHHDRPPMSASAMPRAYATLSNTIEGWNAFAKDPAHQALTQAFPGA